jgi:2-oxoisovalerate dehydrogenase E1 component
MGKSKYFKSRDEFVTVMTALFEKLKSDPKVGPAVAKDKIVVRFEYRNPDASVTINAKEKPANPKDYISYAWDDKCTPTDVVMSNSADYCLRFWQGKENPVISIAMGKLKATGNVAKALSLLPAIKPAYKMFPEILKEMGRKDLII